VPTVPVASYEAESASNVLAGGAVRAGCGACSGRAKVGYVGHGGTLHFAGVAADAGDRTVTSTTPAACRTDQTSSPRFLLR
jgi:hypothetical protein